MSTLEHEALAMRLKELGQMSRGWLDGEGLLPNHGDLEWLKESFDKNYPNDIAFPALYPTVLGNVSAEWSIGACEATLEIDPTKHIGYWHLLDIDKDEEESIELNMESEFSWKWICGRIRELPAAESTKPAATAKPQ